MITIKLKKWVEINGIVHLATTWQIATDQAFTNIVEDVRSETMLEFYYSDIIVPAGEEYYVRAKRHFENPDDDYWSDVMPINNIEKEYSNMLLAHDIRIDKPTVYVDREEITGDSQTITLKTSKFRSKQDGHVYTHWLVRDEAGDVIYSNLYNTTDKEEHVIPNLNYYRDKSKLYFMAIHVGGAGVESPIGKFEVVLHDFNFNVRSYTAIAPRRDALIKVDYIDPNFNKRIKQIKAYDKDYTEFLSINVTDEIEEFVIPWNFVTEDSIIYIEVLAYDKNGKYGTYKTSLKSLSDTAFTEDIVATHSYNQAFEDPVVYESMFIPNGLSTTELGNGDIYGTMLNSDKVHVYKIEDDLLVDTGNFLEGVSLLTLDNENTYIKRLENNILLIDTLNGDGHPVFMLFKYSMTTGVYTLENTLVRSDEITPVGENNGIVQISNSEFVYLPKGSNDLKVFDISANTVTYLATVPFEVRDHANLIRLNNGQLMIFGGTEFITKVYNFDTGQFVDGVTLAPGNFIGNSLKTVRLLNNDVIVFRTIYSEDDVTITETMVSYFDQSQNVFVDVGLSFVDDKYPRTSIVLNDGSVMLAKHTESRYIGVDLKPEEMLVQKFV